MQDDNTTQPADSSSADSTLPEPPLNLSTNPSDAQVPSTESSEPASPEAPAETPEVSSEETTPPAEDTSSDTAVVIPESSDTSTVSPVSSDLESIKSSALQELAPIIGELDQGPEEKYRTLMMIIQSSDNQDLVKDAYEAAQNIEDKKAKAEALVNILNEINYFTGKGEKSGG